MTRKYQFLTVVILLIVALAIPIAVLAQDSTTTIKNIIIPDEIYTGDPFEISVYLEGNNPDETITALFCVVDTEAYEEKPDVVLLEEKIKEDTCPDKTVSSTSASFDETSQKITGNLPGAIEGNYVLYVGVFLEEDAEKTALDIRFESLSVDSPLPASLTRMFAGLGVFIAMMAVMAAGTEVVVDSVKVFFGLKRKVTAMEAFEDLQEQLPGQLKNLGVEKKRIDQFEKFTDEFKSDIEKIKEGIDWDHLFKKYLTWGNILATEPLKKAGEKLFGSIETILKKAELKEEESKALIEEIKSRSITDFSSGSFEETWTKIVTKIYGSGESDAKKKLKALSAGIRAEAKTFLEKNLGPIKEQLKSIITKIIPDGFEYEEKELIEAIDDLDAETIYEALNKAIKAAFEYLSTFSAEEIGKKLDEASKGIEGYKKMGRKTLNAGLDVLEGFGIPLNFDRIHRELDAIENDVDRETQDFIASSKVLIENLEEHRNEIQSPLKLFWRWLRSFSQWSSWLTIFGVAMLWVALSGISLLNSLWEVLALVCLSLIGIFSSYSNIVEVIRSKDKKVKDLYFSLSEEPKFYKQRFVYILAGIFVILALPLKWTAWGQAIYILGSILLFSWFDSTIDWGKYKNILNSIEISINQYIKGQSKDKAKELGVPDQDLMGEIKGLTQTTLAGILLKLESKHVDQEKSRQRWVRIMAFVIGTFLAYSLKIDAILILKESFPSLNTDFNVELAWTIFGKTYNPTPGMIITGLAASAGSKFWHDLLGRLEATKTQAENVAKTVRSMKRSIPSVDDK